MDNCLDRLPNSLMVLATFLLAFIALFREWILCRLWPPKVRIEPYMLEGVLVDVRDPKTSQPRGKGRWYSLAVVNERRWQTPRKCQVLLVAISRRNPSDGRFYRVPLACPLPFWWSPARKASDLQMILRPTVFDFVFLRERGDRVEPGLRYFTNDFEDRGFVKASETVRYELEVVAEGRLSHSPCIYEVTWDGEWREGDSEMAKHLKITRCSSLT